MTDKPAGSPDVGEADVKGELRQLDDELARDAEETIRHAVAQDDPFDLDGEFLSQSQISQIMAGEAAEAAEPQPDQPAAVADEPFQIAEETTQPPLSQATFVDESAPADLSAQVPAEPAVLESPGAPQPPAPDLAVQETPPATERPAETPRAEVLDQPPMAVAAEPPAGPATPAPQPPAATTGDRSVAATPEPPPADSSTAAPASEAASPRSPAAWQRAIVRLATLLDSPFRKVPANTKTALGVLGGATFLIGAVVWAIALLR